MHDVDEIKQTTSLKITNKKPDRKRLVPLGRTGESMKRQRCVAGDDGRQCGAGRKHQVGVTYGCRQAAAGGAMPCHACITCTLTCLLAPPSFSRRQCCMPLLLFYLPPSCRLLKRSILSRCADNRVAAGEEHQR